MIRFWPRSLFGRNLLLLLSLVVITEASALVAVIVLEGPRGTQAGHLLAVEINAIAAAMARTPPAARQVSLDSLVNDGEFVLESGRPPEDDMPINGSIAGEFVRALREGLSPNVAFRWQNLPRSEVWVQLDIAGERQWMSLPVPAMYRGRAVTFFTLASMAAALLAIVAAFLIQRRINRPLKQIAAAARRLGTGDHREKLPTFSATELKAVAEQFNEMTDSLEAMEQTRVEMLAGISHDIRSPLTKLRLSLAMGEGGEQAPEVVYIDQIDAIVGQFLDYGRAGNGEEPVVGDINTLVMQLAGEFEGRGHRFALSLGAVPHLPFRPISMLRIIGNLMENAVRYAGTGLAVETRHERGVVRIDVLDAGPGIEPGQVAHLLRPFTRADAGRSKVSGTGLGLAIVDRLVRLHGGRVELVPRGGGGLRAAVSLPYRRPATAAAPKALPSRG